jgi:hypothetical protein
LAIDPKAHPYAPFWSSLLRTSASRHSSSPRNESAGHDLGRAQADDGLNERVLVGEVAVELRLARSAVFAHVV